MCVVSLRTSIHQLNTHLLCPFPVHWPAANRWNLLCLFFPLWNLKGWCVIQKQPLFCLKQRLFLSFPPPSLFNSVCVTHCREIVALGAHLSSSYYLQSVLYLFPSLSPSVALGWKPLLYLTAVSMRRRPLPSRWDCCCTNGAVITSREMLGCKNSAFSPPLFVLLKIKTNSGEVV